MLFDNKLIKKFYNIVKEEFPKKNIKIKTNGVVIDDLYGYYYSTYVKTNSVNGIFVRYVLSCNRSLQHNKYLELLKTLNEINSNYDVTAVFKKGENVIYFVPILNLVVRNDYKDKTDELKLDYAMRSLSLLMNEIDDIVENGFIAKINILTK